MNKKLGRLFWPGLWVYFTVMVLFAAAALVAQSYILAAVEAGVTILVVVFYIINRERRRKAVQAYANSVFDVPQAAGSAQTPFPMVLIRMGDSSILWSNERFCQITGFQEQYLEQRLGSVLPNFHTDWLTSGKTEYPYDVTLSGRRYRVYGTLIRQDDAEQTVLGMLYFSDLTELYQVIFYFVSSWCLV